MLNKTSTIGYAKSALIWLEQHPIARWILANTIGWMLAFIISGLVIDLFSDALGIIAFLIGGGIIGGVVGASHTWSIRPNNPRRWMLYTVIGGIIGVIPVFLSAFSLIAGRTIGFGIMGALYGLSLGGMQSLELKGDAALVWALTSMLAGCFCSIITFTGWFWIGPVIFGGITGITLAWILREEDI